MRAPAAAAALCLGACLEVPPPSCPIGGDHDGDGWQCGGVVPDCDDGNADINPGVVDNCATGFPEDCNGDPLPCPQDSGLVSSTLPDAATWAVHGGGITATFEEGEQWVLASIETEVDGVELLSRQPPTAEQFVGIGLYPRFDQYQVTSAIPTALDTGAAYVRVQIEWQNTASNEQATGTSTFGVFPDGTIHRHEVFDAPVAYTEGTATMYLVSFWSFDSDNFTTLSASGGETNIATQPNFTRIHHHETGPDDGVLCAYHAQDGRRVTMAWRDEALAAGSRAVVGSEPQHRRLALDYDWYRDTSSISAGVYESTTVLGIDRIDPTGSRCASAATLADVLRQPPPLALESGVPGESADAGGYVVDEGVYEVEAADDVPYVEVTATDTMPRGMMLRVVMDAPDGVTVWRDGDRQRALQDYFVQPTGSGVTVFFIDRIDDGEVLRVAGPGGEPAGA